MSFFYQEDMLDDISLQKKKSSFSAEELDYEDVNVMEDWKPVFLYLKPVFL